MQLQYVFGNPRPKNTRKKKKKLLTRRKSSKIKTRENPAMKKGSKAAKAWGRKMRRAKLAKANPKKKRKVSRKKRKNPQYEATFPVVRKKRSNRFPSRQRVSDFAQMSAYAKKDTEGLAKQVTGMSTDEMLKQHLMGRLQSKVKEMNKYEKLSAKDSKHLATMEKAIQKALAWKEKAAADGAININEIGKNPKGKKMAKRRKKRKAKKNPTVKMKAHSNPKKKRKSSKKRRKSKKSKGSLVRFTGSTRLSKKAIQRFKRRRRLNVSVKINPDFKAIGMTVGFGALGLVATNLLLLPIADWISVKATKKTIAQQLGSVSYIAPVAGTLAGAVVGYAAALGLEKYGHKIPVIGNKTYKAVAPLKMASGVMGIMAAAYFIGKIAQPYTAQALAKVGIATAPMAGVMYFPGMSGADFGMYPQMGDGYKQQPGDFGLIPNGLQGVKYFPNSGMGSVDYFPEGSDGDDMYRQGEAGDLLEAEGLGSPDFGEIPQGMGEVPEGMGEGQLG